MMEKLGFPQTHLGLKAMIKEIDEDQDEKIAYREFLLIFRFLSIFLCLICSSLTHYLTDMHEMAHLRVRDLKQLHPM